MREMCGTCKWSGQKDEMEPCKTCVKNNFANGVPFSLWEPKDETPSKWDGVLQDVSPQRTENPLIPWNDTLKGEGGAHHDQHKVRVDLVPSEAIFAAARVFTEGASKYGDRNWEKGIDSWRLYNSVIRHLLKWNMGEEMNDEDFGLPHLDHALASLMMLITLRMRKEGRKGYEAHVPKEVNVAR